MNDKDRTLKALEDMKESMAYAVRRRATADVVSLEAQVESLSAQVAAQREEEDRLEHTLALVRMDRDHHYERAESLSAQVAELKKDAERVLYKQCDKHFGSAFTFMATTVPYTKIVCPNCDAAKESGVSP